LLFATSSPLNFFSSEVKQYMGDVVCTLVVLLLALRYLDTRGRLELVALAVVGVLAPWVSHAAVFVLASTGIVLAVDALAAAQYARTRELVAVGAAWAASVALVYVVTLRELAADSHLLDWWKDAFAPPPWAPGALGRYRTLAFNWFDGVPVQRYWRPGVALVVAVLGGAALAKRDRTLFTLIVGPLAVVVVVSMAQAYPVSGRLLLFAAPLFLLLLGCGVEAVWQALRPRVPAAGAVAVAVAALAAVSWSWTILRDGLVRQEMRDVFAHIQASAAGPDDVVWVDDLAWAPYLYYRRRFDFHGARAIRGKPYPRPESSRREDLGRLDGESRVWLVFSRLPVSTDENRAMLRLLEELGDQVRPPYERPGVAAYLFDLGSPDSKSSASSVTG
jgi:hypothetical protein